MTAAPQYEQASYDVERVTPADRSLVRVKGLSEARRVAAEQLLTAERWARSCADSLTTSAYLARGEEESSAGNRYAQLAGELHALGAAAEVLPPAGERFQALYCDASGEGAQVLVTVKPVGGLCPACEEAPRASLSPGSLCSRCAASALPFSVGQRVALRRPVERYPFFVAPEGSLGTVTEAEEGGSLFAVTLDAYLPGAEEWENALCWYGEQLTEAPADLLALRGAPEQLAEAEAEAHAEEALRRLEALRLAEEQEAAAAFYRALEAFKSATGELASAWQFVSGDAVENYPESLTASFDEFAFEVAVMTVNADEVTAPEGL